LPARLPRLSRWLVWLLYLLQPIVRGGHRLAYVIGRRASLPDGIDAEPTSGLAKQISAVEWDVYWQSRAGKGREGLLEELLRLAGRVGWPGQAGDGWVDWDLRLIGDRWHDVLVRTATEELGGANRFTRARSTAQPTWLAMAAAQMCVLAGVAASAGGQQWGLVAALVFSMAVLARLTSSRRRCLRAAVGLLGSAAIRVPLEPVLLSDVNSSEPDDKPISQALLPIEAAVCGRLS
jgi:hypothetical protein